MATTTTKKATVKRAPVAARTPRAAKATMAKKSEKVAAVSTNAGSNGTEAIIYGMDGKNAGSIALPAELFNTKWNADLVHQVVTGMQANARPITAHTKNRGEVRGGGKKPWKQKGTGRARHGSSRSPIWKGGGVTFGPRAERVFAVKINKKMRTAALLSVLSKKAKDGEVIFIEKMAFDAAKTKNAAQMISALSKAANAGALVSKSKNAALFAVAEPNDLAKKSLRNIANVAFEEVRSLNPVDLLTHKYLVIAEPAKSLAVLAARAGK